MEWNRVYQTVLDKIERVIVFLTTLFLGLLLLNETVGIFSDLLGHSVPWIPEVSVLLFSWVVFLGAAILSRYGGHIALDVITYRVPSKYKVYFRVFSVILAMVVASVMVYYGTKLAFFAGRYQKSVYLQLSLLYFYLSVPVSGLLLGLNFIGWIFYKPATDEEVLRIEKIGENPLY